MLRVRSGTLKMGAALKESRSLPDTSRTMGSACLLGEAAASGRAVLLSAGLEGSSAMSWDEMAAGAAWAGG